MRRWKQPLSTAAGYRLQGGEHAFVEATVRKALDHLTRGYRLVFTLEDNVVVGGFGSWVAKFYAASGRKRVITLVIRISLFPRVRLGTA